MAESSNDVSRMIVWCCPNDAGAFQSARHFSPTSLLSGDLSSFLRCVRLFVTGGVRLSSLVCVLTPFICLPSFISLHVSPWVVVSASLHLSPFMCLPEWWCPPLRSCLCLVSLHLSPIICLPSRVSLSGCVRLASLAVPCLPSFVSLSGGVRLSGLVCALSPFICLPSCVSLSGGVRLSCLVCALSPFMCLSGGVRLSSLVCVLTPFICLPSFVSLHVSPWVVVSASPV